MSFSHMRISRFRAKAHLIFLCCLHNIKAVCYTAHAHAHVVSILDPSVPCVPTLVSLGLLLRSGVFFFFFFAYLLLWLEREKK